MGEKERIEKEEINKNTEKIKLQLKLRKKN